MLNIKKGTSKHEGCNFCLNKDYIEIEARQTVIRLCVDCITEIKNFKHVQ